jgi:hypothetical protein
LPGLALADYSLIPKVKLTLKGGHFSNISNIQRCVTKPVEGASLQDFLRGFQDLYKPPQHCVKLGGKFFYFFCNQCSLIMYQAHCITHQNLWMHPDKMWEKLHDGAVYFLTWNLL